MVAGAGDEVLIPTPTWPNAAAATGIIGARAGRGADVASATVAGRSTSTGSPPRSRQGRARSSSSRRPIRPAGPRRAEDLAALLALARRHGLWIVADETYARFWYGDGPRAPSFFDVMEPEDRILFVNTFSKNWAMTGWRIGWIAAHPVARPGDREHDPVFDLGRRGIHAARAVAALERGESFVAHHGRARAARPRYLSATRSRATGRVRFAEPQGAFYLFFSVDGEPDTRRLVLRLIDEANVGLAPGTAFGAGGERFVRLCFARNAEQLQTAVDRIASVISRQG